MLLLETERLLIGEAEAEQLPDLLPVFHSHPAYLELTEGTAGQPGLYDLSKLRRDWHIVQMTPGRHLCGIYVKPSQAAVGVLDFMEESPADGLPWIGLLMIHARHQRQGYGAEALRGLLDHGRDQGWPVVRAAVLTQHESGLAFARAVGFQPLPAGRGAAGSGRGASVVVLERPVP